jgi:uncharacterized membrane protein
MDGNYSPAQSTNFDTTALATKEEDLARALEQQREELQSLAEERSKVAEATTQLQQERVALEVCKCVLNTGSHSLTSHRPNVSASWRRESHSRGT